MISQLHEQMAESVFDPPGMSNEQLQKQITYAEGLSHGFAVAQDLVSTRSQGALTLNEPDIIRTWLRRLSLMKIERCNRRAEMRQP